MTVLDEAILNHETQTELKLESKTDALSALGHWGFYSYHNHLKKRFPEMEVRKLSLNAGFTCPNLDGTVARGGCTYCNNQGFVPERTRKLELEKQWERGREFLRHRYRKADAFIAYFQAFSNTHAPLKDLEHLYRGLASRLPECVGLSLGTRPDCLGAAVCDFLEELSSETFLTVEIGLQSDRDSVLQSINRGHDLKAFLDAVYRLEGRGMELCAHLILGLPEEGEDAPERMGKLMASLPIHSLKVHNLHIMKGTAMEKQCKEKGFETPNKELYLHRMSRLLKELRPDQALQRVLADAPDRILINDRWTHDKQGFLSELAKKMQDSSYLKS